MKEFRGKLKKDLQLSALDIPALLRKAGKKFCEILAEESLRAFELRGWSPNDPMGGPPIYKSFSYQVEGNTLHVLSSFYGLDSLVEGIPSRRLEWLTQEAKKAHPENYEPTARERALGKVRPNNRLPLVIPIREGTGTVVFRSAPLTVGEAWIHPGIAKFNFMGRAHARFNKYIMRTVAEGVVLTFVSQLQT